MNPIQGIKMAMVVALVLGFGSTAVGQTKKQDALQPGKRPAVAAKSSFRALVNKVPTAARTKFMDSIVFKNGALAGAYIADVKESLSPTEFTALMKSVGCNDWKEGWYCSATRGCIELQGNLCNPDKCSSQPKAGVQMSAVRFGDLELPAGEKQKFYESLDFVDGRLVSAYTSGPEKHLSATNYNQLFKALGADPNAVKAPSKAGQFRR